MRRFLGAVTAALMLIAAPAKADFFSVNFPLPKDVVGSWEPEWQAAFPESELYNPIIHMTGVKAFRLNVQGFGFSGYPEQWFGVTVEVSIDGGRTWRCLGYSCVTVKIYGVKNYYATTPPQWMPIPMPQRSVNAILRLSVHPGSEVAATGTLTIAQIQFLQ